MKNRPWIWIILANLVLMGGIVTLVVIAVKHQEPSVPIEHGR